MASKFLVPLHLPNLSSTPSASASSGFVKVYVKSGYLKYLSSAGVETDAVLARPLDSFAVAATAAAITSSDTVLSAFGKIQKSLNSITFTGDVSGSASYVGGALTISTTVNSNTVVLGTDTTGDYIANIEALPESGIEIQDGVGEGAVTKVGLAGAAGFNDGKLLSWDQSAGELKSAPISTDGTNITIDGNLTVNGTTTTVNSEIVTIADNFIVLNSNVTGTPTENAGIEVERGTSTNVSIRWNETTDKWQITEDGTTFYDIVTSASAPSVVAGSGIDVSTSGATVTVSHEDTSSATGSTNAPGSTEVIQNVDIDGFGHVTGITTVALKYTEYVGNNIATAFTVNHNKNEQFVIVQVFEASSPFEQVECTVTITSPNTVQVEFYNAPTVDQYVVVVI